MAIKPNFQQLWNEFPRRSTYQTLESLHTAIGGVAARNIHAPGFGKDGNTCASRLSVAFNRSNAPIDSGLASSLGITTLGSAKDGIANGYRIIFRITEFKKYLKSILGNPTSTDNTSPYDDAFVGKQGIIAFNVNGWSDARGHIALWDGEKYRDGDSDNYAMHSGTQSSEFWELS